MHYSFFVTVAPNNTADNPAVEVIHLGAGILENIKIFFPIGCSGVIHCNVSTDAVQLLPSNQNSYYALDGGNVDANVHFDLTEETNVLYLIAWTVGSSYSHTLTLHAEVRGPDEPSVDVLESRLLDTLDRIAELIRSTF